MQASRLPALLLIVLSLPASSAFARVEPMLPISEQLQSADVVLFMRWIGGEPAISEGEPDELTCGSARFEVVHVLKNNDTVWEETAVIELQRSFDAESGTWFLYQGVMLDKLEWFPPQRLSEAGIEYIRDLAELSDRSADRLRCIAGYLEHSDRMIAHDAWMEFGFADYADVVAVLPELDSATILKWILDTETQPEHVATYGWMLGMTGAKEHAPAIEEFLLQPSDRLRLGLDGVMAGYVMLTGLEGWEWVEREKLLNPEAPFSETYAAMQALRLLWRYPPEGLSRERCILSMRSLLGRPDIADLVIADLARWHDWSVIEELHAMYDAEGFTEPYIRRAIVRYMLHAEHAGSLVEGDSIPEFARTATRYLEEFKQRDPTTFENAIRYFRLREPMTDPSAPPAAPSHIPVFYQLDRCGWSC